MTMRKRVMRGYRGNHHEKLEHQRILCAMQFTISNTAGLSPDPVCTNTDTRSSQPNQASYTPGFSYRLVSTIQFGSWTPISLFLVLNSIIIGDHEVNPSLYITLLHDHESTQSTESAEYSILAVQHTVSTAYSKYRIQQVQHTVSTTYSKYNIHRVQCTLTTA
jgi:hypothetical protein